MQLVDIEIGQLELPDNVAVNRRDEDRYAVEIDIEAIRLDDDLRPIGAPLLLKSRDISNTGICFTSELKIFEDFLLLRIPIARSHAVVRAKLVWEEKRSTENFYRFGAKFLIEPGPDAAWPEGPGKSDKDLTK